MKAYHLRSCQQPKYNYKRAAKEHIVIPNHLNREFNVTKPNEVWCGDAAYIWTGKRWAYLAVVLKKIRWLVTVVISK